MKWNFDRSHRQRLSAFRALAASRGRLQQCAPCGHSLVMVFCRIGSRLPVVAFTACRLLLSALGCVRTAHSRGAYTLGLVGCCLVVSARGVAWLGLEAM